MKTAGFLLYLDQITHTYNSKNIAVDGVSFGLKRGEKIAVIGPNGAGKTTLLLAIAGLIPSRGTVFYEETPVGKNKFDKLRRRMGFLFQSPDDQLFCKTVFDDVAFGPKCLGFDKIEVETRTVEILKEFDILHLSGKSPFQLSKGEKKRVALAGILAAEPEILIMDEPGGGLDPFQRKTFIEFMKKDRRSMIFATHDMDLAAETALRCILLFEGRIRADGPAHEILSEEELLRKCMLELPLRRQGYLAAREEDAARR